jgi:hypothetical protein
MEFAQPSFVLLSFNSTELISKIGWINRSAFNENENETSNLHLIFVSNDSLDTSCRLTVNDAFTVKSFQSKHISWFGFENPKRMNICLFCLL